MFIVKGFAINSSFTDNTPGVINQFGELSPQSLTYSLEKGFYKNNAYNNLTLVTFSCTETNVAKELQLALSNEIIEVINYVYAKTTANPTVEITVNSLLLDMTTDLGAVGKDFKCGTIESDGTHYVPQWIEYVSLSDDSVIHVWFIDTAFSTQYDEYVIKFSAPFEILDDFFAAGYTVEQRLKLITPELIVESLQDKKGNDPETFIKLELFDYHDPFDPNRIIPTNWGVLGYGAVASNIDVMKEELIDFILSNSTHSREDWTEIFPDIFKRTEFVLVPYWENYSIEPRPLTPGIYGPMVGFDGIGDRLKTVLPDYTRHQIDTYGLIQSFPFKSLLIASIGSVENRENKFSLLDYFPDFINVSSTSEDFNRMSLPTREWSVFIHELVVFAENSTPDTILPLYISKITRDGVFYLSRVMDRVQYLVATKHSVENLFG